MQEIKRRAFLKLIPAVVLAPLGLLACCKKQKAPFVPMPAKTEWIQMSWDADEKGFRRWQILKLHGKDVHGKPMTEEITLAKDGVHNIVSSNLGEMVVADRVVSISKHKFY